MKIALIVCIGMFVLLASVSWVRLIEAEARYECNMKVAVALEIVGVRADMSTQTGRYIKMDSYSLSSEDIVGGAVDEVEPLIERYRSIISDSVIAGGKPGGKRVEIKYMEIDVGAIIRDIRSGEC